MYVVLYVIWSVREVVGPFNSENEAYLWINKQEYPRAYSVFRVTPIGE